MASQFVIQVVDKDTGLVVEWAPGMACERQLVTELGGRVVAKGVGYFKSAKQVQAAVTEALRELLFALKSDVPSR